MKTIHAPRAEYLEHKGDSHMRWSLKRAQSFYDFFKDFEKNYNELVGDEERPQASSLSYMDYIIKKLLLSQKYLMVGMILSLHISPKEIKTFESRIKKETKWRLMHGDKTSVKSWLRKGGMTNIPEGKGVVLRGFSDHDISDPEGWKRPLGSFQDYAQKNHFHKSNLNFSTPMVGSNFPDFHVMREGRGEKTIQTTSTLGANVSEHEERMKNISVLFIVLT